MEKSWYEFWKREPVPKVIVDVDHSANGLKLANIGEFILGIESSGNERMI